jgi:hypothetical protein
MPPAIPVYTRALDLSEKLFADVRNTGAHSIIGTVAIDIDSPATAFDGLLG